MKKPLLIALVVVAAIGVAFAASRKRSDVAGQPTAGKLAVAASFYPLAEFSRNVGGVHADVWTATPPGAEPHDFEPAPNDITRVYASDVLVANGGGLDPWIEKLVPEFERRGGVALVMEEEIPFRDGSEDEPQDPHIWLDPTLAAQEVERIRDAFAEADPAHAADYEANAQAYVAELAIVDREYAAGLASCATPEIVSAHDAFGYLAARYGFKVHAITGISPDEEPSAGELARLADLVRARGIKYVFFEDLVSPKLAETLARETGAEAVALNPLEGLLDSDIAAGENYLTVMRENLATLRNAMSCK